MMIDIIPEWLSKPGVAKIAVVGDLILDEYLEGQVDRISPEAPVPVHLVSERRLSAGGAANVAANISALGGKASLFGFVGGDLAGDELIQLLEKQGVGSEQVLKKPQWPTIRKTRISANRQQLIRVDWEEALPIGRAESQLILEGLKQWDGDLVILSDYGKGCLTADFLTEVIAWCHKTGKPVLVDPKGKDYRRYQGADLITPNLKEACLALGEIEEAGKRDFESIVRNIASSCEVGAAVVTLGAEGMIGFETSRGCLTKGDDRLINPHQIRARARDVYDVSGAGDTVVASIGLCLAMGESLKSAMNIANHAAGLVVEKWGTQPVDRQELLEALVRSEQYPRIGSRFKCGGQKEIVEWAAELKQRGKSIVFTNGCFDILHAGHLSYLERARSYGDYLVVGVNSDDSVKRLKGDSRPINDLESRMALLGGLACVDKVFSFDELTPLSAIKSINPDILVKGADYKLNEIVGADHVLGQGGRVETVPLVDGLSTSSLINRASESGVGIS